MIRRAAVLAACACLLAGLGAAPVAASPAGRESALLGILNTPPVPLPDVYVAVHDRKLKVKEPGVLANDLDVDGDELEAKVVQGPAHGKLNLNHDGGFDYEPAPGFTGLDAFTYAADDGGALKIDALVTITVTNSAPVGHDDRYSVTSGDTLQVDRPGVLKNDDDADGDELTAKLVNGPDHGELDLRERGEFDYEPDHGFAGTDVFTYRALDGAAQSAVIRVTIDVVPRPSPTPAATPTPKPTPDPTTNPEPTPRPTSKPTPKPDKPKDPEPRPTRAPGDDGGSAGAGGGTGDDGDGGKGGGGTAGGPGGTAGGRPDAGGARPEAPNGLALARPLGDGSAGPSVAFEAGMAAAFEGFAWQVPALVLSVPGLLVVLAVGLQLLGALAWVPLVRRRLGDDGDGLTPPERRP